MATKRAVRQTYARIRDTSRTLPRIDPARVQTALGAESANVVLGGTGGPVSVMQVRQEIFARLQSTGGRPGLSDTSQRVKIPLNKKQWEQLEELASEVRAPGFSPSPAQIASVLISLSLRSLGRHEDSSDDDSPARNDVLVH